MICQRAANFKLFSALQNCSGGMGRQLRWSLFHLDAPSPASRLVAEDSSRAARFQRTGRGGVAGVAAPRFFFADSQPFTRTGRLELDVIQLWRDVMVGINRWRGRSTAGPSLAEVVRARGQTIADSLCRKSHAATPIMLV